MLEANDDAKAFLITITFDPHRNRYLRIPCGTETKPTTPTRSEVEAGMTRTLPESDFNLLIVGDVARWYFQLSKRLLGSHHTKMKHRQPLGIGAFDVPSPRKRNADQAPVVMRKTANQDFVHAHIVLCLTEIEQVKRFEKLLEDKTLEALWRGINREGDIDVRPINRSQIGQALSYAMKNADQAFGDGNGDIILPAIDSLQNQKRPSGNKSRKTRVRVSC
jgi:hypothetical protein